MYMDCVYMHMQWPSVKVKTRSKCFQLVLRQLISISIIYYYFSTSTNLQVP